MGKNFRRFFRIVISSRLHGKDMELGRGGGGCWEDAERIAKAVGVRSSSTPDGFCRVHLPGLGQDTQVLWMEELQTVAFADKNHSY